jgi:hypothetical protein
MKYPCLILVALLGGCAVEPRIAVVEVGEDFREGARIMMAVHEDTLLVEAISPRGSGHTRVLLKEGQWPPKLLVRLRYAMNRTYTRLESFSAELENPARPAAKQPLPASTGRVSGGAYVIDVGPVPHEPGMNRLHISWVDAYK